MESIKEILTIKESGEISNDMSRESNYRGLFPGQVYKLNNTDYFCLFLILKGGGVHVINSISYLLEGGSVHLVYPGQEHKIKLKAEAEVHSIFIHKTFFNTYALHFKFIFSYYLSSSVVQLSKAGLDNLLKSFETLQIEISNNKLNFKIIQLHLRLISELIRREACGPIKMEEHSKNLLVLKFIELVEEQYKKHKDVGFYARELGVTTSHLNLCSRKHLLCTASDIIYNRIIREAYIVLESNDLLIKEIANLLGFEDASYFTRFFKNRTGVSPRKFRFLYPQIGWDR